MYDSINVSTLPAGGDLYAGYDDGDWPDAAAIAARFPGKTVIRITTNPNNNEGTIGDGPPDNGAWDEWTNWVLNRRAEKVDPTINTNQSSWAAGIAAFKAANVAQPHWWIANYDGDPTIPAGAVAKQYASGTYDTSSVVAYWPGVDPAPVTTPPPATTLEEDDDMKLVIAPRSGDAGAPTDVFLLGNGEYKHVPTQGYVDDLVAFGVPAPELINYPLHGFFLANFNGVAVS
jgi:hypothetical protein